LGENAAQFCLPRPSKTLGVPHLSLRRGGGSVCHGAERLWLRCDFTQFGLGGFEGWIAEVGAGDEELVEREGLIEGASDESRLGWW